MPESQERLAQASCEALLENGDFQYFLRVVGQKEAHTRRLSNEVIATPEEQARHNYNMGYADALNMVTRLASHYAQGKE